jgi:hypothetical protein
MSLTDAMTGHTLQAQGSRNAVVICDVRPEFNTRFDSSSDLVRPPDRG